MSTYGSSSKSNSPETDDETEEQVPPNENDNYPITDETFKAIKNKDGLALEYLRLAREELSVGFGAYDVQLIRAAMLIAAISFIAPSLLSIISSHFDCSTIVITLDPLIVSLPLTTWLIIVSTVCILCSFLLATMSIIPRTLKYPTPLMNVLSNYPCMMDPDLVLLKLAYASSKGRQYNQSVINRIARQQLCSVVFLALSLLALIAINCILGSDC